MERYGAFRLRFHAHACPALYTSVLHTFCNAFCVPDLAGALSDTRQRGVLAGVTRQPDHHGGLQGDKLNVLGFIWRSYLFFQEGTIFVLISLAAMPRR